MLVEGVSRASCRGEVGSNMGQAPQEPGAPAVPESLLSWAVPSSCAGQLYGGAEKRREEAQGGG